MGTVPEQTLHITVVSTRGCHLCDDALSLLAAVGDTLPVAVTCLDLQSPEGGRLMRAHRAAMMPLVLVDGAFFSSGRLPRGKLQALLAAHSDLIPTGAGRG